MPNKSTTTKNAANAAWFTASLKLLREATTLLRTVPSSRSVLPILSHVLVQTTTDALTLAATDLNVFLSLQVPAQVDGADLALALPAHTFGDWLNAQPLTSDAMLAVQLDAERATAELKVARHTAHLKGIAASEFPAKPSLPDGVTVTLDSAALAQSLRRVAFTAGSEKEGRPILEGVLVTIAPATLTLAAADGYQLGYDELVLDDTGERPTLQGVVPTDALDLIVKLIDHASPGAPLTLALDANRVRLALGDSTEVIATLIDGTYPQVERIIPTGRTTQAALDPVPLRDALQAAASFTYDGIALTFTPQTLVLAGVESEVGDLTAEIPLRSSVGLKTPFSVRVQRAFLRQMLATLPDADELVFDLDPTEPKDRQHPEPLAMRLPSVPTWRYVVMPLAK